MNGLSGDGPLESDTSHQTTIAPDPRPDQRGACGDHVGIARMVGSLSHIVTIAPCQHCVTMSLPVRNWTTLRTIYTIYDINRKATWHYLAFVDVDLLT